MPLTGILVVDKPAGITSARVVSGVRRALSTRRVGHTGTLDPLATGVLPLCLGEATKLAGYLLADDKGYEAEIELGVDTDTLDAEGVITRRRPERAAAVTAAILRREMAALVGEQDQRPPMYSAVKRGGRRLHELARAGETVVREPRRVRVDAFELAAFEPPRARVTIRCSKGTYVRSLAADLGERLGCGAHVARLRRTRAGVFDEDRAIPLSDVDPRRTKEVLIPPPDAVAQFAAAPIPPDRLRAVSHGQPLPWEALEAGEPPADRVRLLTPEGHLAAIARVIGGRLVYDRVFRYALPAKPS